MGNLKNVKSPIGETLIDAHKKAGTKPVKSPASDKREAVDSQGSDIIIDPKHPKYGEGMSIT